MGLFRLLLAIAVVMSHSGGSLPWGFHLTSGSISVQAFYIISGFYMALILSEKYEYSSNGAWLFYSNRALRLYPLFWTFLLLALLLELYKETSPTFIDILGLPLTPLLYFLFANIFILFQDTTLFLHVDPSHGQISPALDYAQANASAYLLVPQAWSIGVEIWFYMLAPMLTRWSTRALIILISITLLGRIAFFFFFPGHYYGAFNYRFFPFELTLFLMGSLAYRAYKVISWSRLGEQRTCLIAVLPILLPIFLTISFRGIDPFSSESVRWLYLISVAFCLPALFFATKAMSLDKLIGELSYPIYLSQFVVISAVTFTPVQNWPPGFRSLTIVLITILLSWLAIVTINQPIEKFRQARILRAARSQKIYTVSES